MTERIIRLRCFIASPGDCAQERRTVATVVRRVDRLVARRLGFSMEPLGWREDAIPDVGRPQEIVNSVLDRSDLAVFLFWHRLGTEAGLGLTGAEEEFYRTLERNQGSGRPRILLYFNEADPPAAKVDPDQLIQLKQFRRRLDEGRILLYGTFRAQGELRERLEEALVEELFARSASTGPKQVSGLREGTESAVDRGERAFLLDRMIHNLREQVARLEILNDEPKTLAHLKTEIDRLERLKGDE